MAPFPDLQQVWSQAINLWDDHVREREKAAAFYERQDTRNAKYEAEGKTDKIKWRNYTGKPTYIDQIGTSLKTVGLGFLIATIIAVPLGIASGLVQIVQRCDQSADPDFQAGVSAGLAADRHDDRVGHLCQSL